MKPARRVLFGIPMTGLLRSEWFWGMTGMATPTNWAQSHFAWPMSAHYPLNFSVADARNIIVDKFVLDKHEWLFFIDHDVIPPPDMLLKWNNRILDGKLPLWGGLYFTKSFPAEPLVYRGRGTTYYDKWKLGDKVWCDGMGLGCHVIHHSILKILWEESEEYEIWGNPGMKARRVFESPSFIGFDEKTGKPAGVCRGTEDLPFYERIMKDKVLKRAGFPELQRRKYPFLCDTSVFCRHVDWNGIQYPAHGEEQKYKK
jgi:hypothetical protein